MYKRRSILKGLGAGAAALTLGPKLAGCGDDGESGPPAELTHVVVVCMENRSYDHLLGGRKLAGLGNAGDGLTAELGNVGGDGQLVKVFPANVMCVADPPHEWEESRHQFADGAMSGFLISYEGWRPEAGDAAVMSYLTETQVPWTWALAAGSTACDRWFSSVLGPTWPNRFYLLSGQSFGFTENVTPDGGNHWPSLFHRLNDKGVGWAYYFSDLPVVPLWQDLGDDAHVKRVLDFFDDAAAGTLPPVTFIDPGFTLNDDHPPHHPMLGQQFLASIYAALSTSPQWENILLVITYDEHGGFYDHVPPPAAPDERTAEGFGQLGVRVPTIVAGPWAKQGAVSSVQYDHTSVIRHIAKMHGLEALTMRDAAANDLSDALDAERLAAHDPAPPLSLPPVVVNDDEITDACFKRGPRYVGYHPCDIELLANRRPGFFGPRDLRAPKHAQETLRRVAWELERRGMGGIERRRG